MVISRLGALTAIALLVPLLGVAEHDDRPACVRSIVEMTSDVDSAHARSGDSFQFKNLEAVHAPDGTLVPAETPGFGVVAIAQHAQRGGRGGYVVTIDWTTAARATATGSSRDIPGIVGAIPFVGYVLGPYGFIHHGSDVTIAHGTRLPVLVGDDVATAACRIVPPASPTPAPSPSPSSGTSASPMPAPSPAPS